MSEKWTAQVQVKWNKDAPNSWEWMKDWSEVKWAASTMGDWDMTLWIDVQTPEALENFVQNKLWEKSWVADTKSTWTKEVWNTWQATA